MKRAAAAALLGAALCVGCGGRWLPPKTYEVPTQTDQRASYTAVLELAASKGYTVLTRDDAAAKARLQAKSNGKSFIDVEVAAGQVKLVPMGALVRDGKVHRVLTNELNNLEVDLQQRFGASTTPAVASAAPASPPPVAAPAGIPQAWTEASSNGNFTCLPVRVPPEHQSALTLQLSNGEKADLLLSLGYAPEFCHSAAQCKQPGGCPALGIGDPDRVNRIATRLSKGEIGAQATLLDGGQPVATIDLAHHGSVVQAMSEIKR
jgi:hypothetical protein